MTRTLRKKQFCITTERKSSCDTFSKDNAKILPTSYFGYFGHVWPLSLKTRMST